MQDNQLPWIEPDQNPWRLPLLDLRPITQTMIASSKDPVFAENALSYAAEDGIVFWNRIPEGKMNSKVNLSYKIDGKLEAGVLFSPDCMEHKWAIFFDGENIIVVRSWLRELVFLAKTEQKDNVLTVHEIRGQISDSDAPKFIAALFNFLILSHCLSEVVPAPLPAGFENDTENAAYWAFSLFGNMAFVGSFDENLLPKSTGTLRSRTLFHIAAAKSDPAAIEKYINQGFNINAIAGDGLRPLHWSSYADGVVAMKMLIDNGADLNLPSLDGTTVLMQAVEANKLEQVEFLLKSGALVNLVDERGFSALHRAAEMGHIDIVKILLHYSADKNIKVDSHTALSLAMMNKHKEIVDLLKV
jgi:hypothetical protein